MAAKFFMNSQRIRGIDYEGAPKSFKFDNSTRKTFYWHENQYYYEDNTLVNRHVPLNPQGWNNGTNLAKLVYKSAKHWNIKTWSDKEDYPLLDFENEN